jgi:hypothetical protein
MASASVVASSGIFPVPERVYEYPESYPGRSGKLISQVKFLAEVLKLSPTPTTQFVQEFLSGRVLPDHAEGWFAIPSITALARVHFPGVLDPVEQNRQAAQLILSVLGKRNNFKSYVAPAKSHFRLEPDTAEALQALTVDQQDADILIVGAQLGRYYRSRSVDDVRAGLRPPEFAAHTVGVGSILITHPGRIFSERDLWMDVPGDMVSCGNRALDHSPAFVHDDRPAYAICASACWTPHSGAATFFVP